MLARPLIRLAVPEDAQSIANFSRELIEHGLGWSYTRPRIVRLIQSPAVNVAVTDGIAGVSSFGIMEYGSTSGRLVLLGVQPTERRRGMGRKMHAWLEQCARDAGLERLCVEARADNPGAIAFYQQLDYRITQRVPGYYRGMLDGVRLEKRLWKVFPTKDG